MVRSERRDSLQFAVVWQRTSASRFRTALSGLVDVVKTPPSSPPTRLATGQVREGPTSNDGAPGTATVFAPSLRCQKQVTLPPET